MILIIEDCYGGLQLFYKCTDSFNKYIWAKVTRAESVYYSLISSIVECTGGQVYQSCGTACPRTCDNYQLDIACILECVSGCFCPDDTVLHEGECISSSLCPGESMLNIFLCIHTRKVFITSSMLYIHIDLILSL